MSRQPKFRAWLPKAKKMTRAHTIPEWADVMRGLPKDGIVFLEQTNLLDKDGSQIFEGDRIGHWQNVVEWSEGGWCVNGDRPLRHFNETQKVLGNIYEHPQ